MWRAAPMHSPYIPYTVYKHLYELGPPNGPENGVFSIQSQFSTCSEADPAQKSHLRSAETPFSTPLAQQEYLAGEQAAIRHTPVVDRTARGSTQTESG